MMKHQLYLSFFFFLFPSECRGRKLFPDNHTQNVSSSLWNAHAFIYLWSNHVISVTVTMELKWVWQCLWSHLAVHAAEFTLLHNKVTGGLQEMRAEVTFLNVLILITTVPGPWAWSGRKEKQKKISISCYLLLILFIVEVFFFFFT